MVGMRARAVGAGALGATLLAAMSPKTAHAAGQRNAGDAQDAAGRMRAQAGLQDGNGQDATDKGEASKSEQPQDFKYTHLWVSKDGETHISEGAMTGFVKKSFAAKGAEQYVKKSDIKPDNISFSQLEPGTFSPMHSCPGVQFVVCMSGSWFVKTSDGTRKEFAPGEVLFQDNVENSPADKPPEHESGTVGDEPCNQMIIQVDRKPEVDNPCPL